MSGHLDLGQAPAAGGGEASRGIEPLPHWWDLMPPAGAQDQVELNCRPPAGVKTLLGYVGTLSSGICGQIPIKSVHSPPVPSCTQPRSPQSCEAPGFPKLCGHLINHLHIVLSSNFPHVSTRFPVLAGKIIIILGFQCSAPQTSPQQRCKCPLPFTNPTTFRFPVHIASKKPSANSDFQPVVRVRSPSLRINQISVIET